MARIYNWASEKAFRVDEDGCLIWRGVVHSDDDPIVYIRDGGRRGYRSVRRAILALVRGKPLRKEERVSAKCGKKKCCSPLCLQAVTYSTQNRETAARTGYAQDMDRRRRISAAKAKVWTDAQVADIRARVAAGESPRAVAAAYLTSYDRIYNIVTYRSRTVGLPSHVRQSIAEATRRRKQHAPAAARHAASPTTEGVPA